MSDSVDVASCFSCTSVLTLVIIGVFLLLLSGIFSGSKVAYLSLNLQQKKALKKSGKLTSRAILRLVAKIEDLLALISVVNCFNYVAIAIVWIYATSPLLSFMPDVLRYVVQLLLLVPLLLVLCEVAPKMFARQNPALIVSVTAMPLLALGFVLKPVTYLVARSNRGIERQVHRNQSISMDELSDVIEEESPGLINEREMLKGIIEFGNIEVSEIMCPRVDMIAIESKEPFEQVLKRIMDSGYSRMPVYSDTYDQISGILYIKDLLPYVNNKNGFNWQSLIRPPHFVPENKKINELLEELQMQKNHMAIVVDEYGGTSGLVTMEDIIEMIVGDISDEFDEEESDFTRIDPDTYIFKGKTLLSDLCDEMNIEPDHFAEVQGESESLAGLILEMKGELPRKNEKFECRGFSFVVMDVDRRRITSVKVHREEPSNAESES